MKHNALGWIFLMLLAMSLGSPAVHAQLYVEQTLHSFSGGTTDGNGPYSGLTNVNGLLYGTTSLGGTNNNGIIYSIKPDGSGYQMRCSFGPSGDVNGAFGDLILFHGLLYGTSQGGGTYNNGTIYSFDPATNTEKILHSFGAYNGDEYYPSTALIEVNGILYGTTDGGYGTVFSFDPASNTEKVIYTFGAYTGDGAGPYGGLIAVNGILYGTTQGGGAFNNGTVYSLDPATKVEHILHDFNSAAPSSEGAEPEAALINVNGTLYGTTAMGGTANAGTIFSLMTDGSGYQTLYSFQATSSTDGSIPVSALINVNGKLYGTTESGGNDNGGIVFSFDPSTEIETTVYRLTSPDSNGDNSDGTVIETDLLSINGVLYGTAVRGGTNAIGTIFSLVPAAPPTANNDAGRGIANHSLTVTAPGVLGNDNHGGDPNTTAAIVTKPTHGTITFHFDGSFTYTPSKNFVGTDSFTYKDTNFLGTSNTATCSLTIGPIAYDDAGRTYYNTPVTINAPGVLFNDITGGLSTTASLVTNPSHGTITLNSNGGFTYIPTTGFLGTDSFTYKITNSAGTSAPATCIMTVQARTPVANNDAGRVTHNTTLIITAPGVLGNDNLGDTGSVTAAIVTNPTHGTITFHTDGSFVYKPTNGFIGTDSFTYKDTNAIGTSNIATCTLTVQ